MMIIHILVDTSQVLTQDNSSTCAVDNTLWSTTNIFTFTSIRSQILQTIIKYLNYINYDISWITVQLRL